MTKAYNYKKKENGKNDTGAPAWEPSPAQLKILEDSFKLGALTKEALAQAKIPSSTFYDYLKSHPDFSEQIEWWQQYPIMLAKHSVVSHMGEDGELALKYLRYKCKDEFNTRTEITGANGESFAMPSVINVVPVRAKEDDEK